MAVPTIGELLGTKTKETIFDELIQACIDEGLPTTAWQPGEPIRAVLSIVARVLAALWSTLATPAMRGAFLDYAEGPWLTLLAWTTYNVRRRGAEFATGNVTLENRSGSFSGAIAVGQVRIVCTDTGKTYTNIESGAILAWPGSPAPYPTVELAFRADEAGSASDALSGDISTTPITAPTGIFVQSAPDFRGSDGETDESLRERCRLSQAVLSPAGPADAYRFIALSTNRPDGSPVPVNRVRVVDEGNCTVSVYLASPSGTITGNMSAGDVFYVYTNLLRYVVPAGFTCNVYGATELEVSVAIELYVDQASGLTEDEAENAALEELSVYMSTLPIGGLRKVPAVTPTDSGFVFVSELEAESSEAVRRLYESTLDAQGLPRTATGAKKGIIKAEAIGLDTTVAYNEVAVMTPTTIHVNIVKQ